MTDKALAPIVDRLEYSDLIERIIQYGLWVALYQPLLEILREDSFRRLNSKSSFKAALISGRVQYKDGYVVGLFNASVSKDIRSLGGEWNKTKKAFKLTLSGLPTDVREAIAKGDERIKHVKDKIEAQLEVMEHTIAHRRLRPEVDKPLATIDVTSQFAAIVGDLDQQYRKTVGASLQVPMEMSGSMHADLARDYSENLDLYIKGWEEEAIFRLRKQVNINVERGFRSETMIKSIQSEYDVTKKKAKFLARQETSLLVSKYRESRYKDAGIEKYRWATSHDERVRKDHKDLSGRVFSFDNPPVTDTASGARNNPGEDFNCRCVAVPLLREAVHQREAVAA